MFRISIVNLPFLFYNVVTYIVDLPFRPQSLKAFRANFPSKYFSLQNIFLHI